ncbi:MAG: hypothetical protein KKD74_13275 [Bacteroidetes bacterium]|nr:hypothetical protein [Bacteroidota bacterium]
MMRWILPACLCVLVFLCLVPMAQAQEDVLFDSIDNQIIYSHERVGTVIATNLGLGAGFRKGINKNAFNTRVLSFEFVSMRSPKQVKVINPYYNNAKRYVYGKLNDVFMLRASYGNKKLLNRKPYWGGVELRWVYDGGASLAFEKPYYLFVRKVLGNNTVVIETELFSPDISWDNIYGRAPFTKGFSELKVIPGVFVHTGINAEFGYVKTSIKALEAGLTLEAFPQGVSIMDDNLKQKFFATFYLSFSFGRRFNKY